MAALVLVAVVLLFAAASEAQIRIGGATSFADVATEGMASVSGNFPFTDGTLSNYQSVGSTAGKASFIDRGLEVAYSDVPLTLDEDSRAGGSEKLTIPVAVAAYSFCTQKKGGNILRLSASQLFNIYTSNSFIRWSTYISKASGNVLPVARSDDSGSTQMIGTWLNSQVAAWPYTDSISWRGRPGVSSKIRYVNGAKEMYQALRSDSNRIGYIQAGACTATNGVPAVAINNAAGKFVVTNAKLDVDSLMPSPIPAYDGSEWSAVSLINKPGISTYPIVGIVYMFVRKDYYDGDVNYLVYKWVQFCMGSQVQDLNRYYGFYPIPYPYRGAGNAAADLISVN